jgi:hypothetical protein
VNNVAPVFYYLTVPPASINENESVSLSGSFIDPGTKDKHTLYINWGDGSAAQVIGLAEGARDFAVSHQYLDDNPTGTTSDTNTITVTVSDDDAGASAPQTRAVTVNNEAPMVVITGPPSGAVFPVGYEVPFTGTFTDPGTLDTHTYQWTFDNIVLPASAASVTSEPSNSNSGTVNTSYSFTTPGVYQIKLTVTDDDGGSGSANTSGGPDGLIAQVVIYDPNGGFVTGGGWIDSPLDAYLYDPSLTGKATFGFVSKYLKGANKPTGQTEFQFKAGNFNFQSSYYDWLVVAGAKAQYKGTGTINGIAAPAGAGNYKFMLTATDGQLPGGGGYDKFRIKIWYEVGATSYVVYDNKRGLTDDFETAPTQALGGGSIVVHK